MLTCRLCRWVVVALACAVSNWGCAVAAQQPAEAAARPRIGLVLEGGGALGFAHIGVIQWMEEHHIPVDDVAGTSMGGLVGGLYASGMSPKQIKQFVGGIDWATVLNGQTPFRALSYRRKEDRLAFPNRLDFGLKHGLSLPSGLNSGSAVGLLLDEKTLPYYNLKSFDDLPIRFRCVATDMTTGGPHVFEDGSLGQALRSTMSIPGVFSPVSHGTQIYSDGAAVDNLPVDVARKMGAQVVIAVYLDTGPVDLKSLNSLVGVAGRNVSIMIANNERESMKNANILIKADVSKFTSSDFTDSTTIIPKGYEAAQAHAAELEKYALSDADWKAYVAARDARRRTSVPVPQFVEIYGLRGTQKAEVAADFKKYVGKKIDSAALDRTIEDVLGRGTYGSVSYNLIDRDGQTGLLIRPRLKAHAPPFLNLGLTLTSDDTNNIQLGMGARATFVDIAGIGSELRVDGSVGQVAQVSGELYRPLSATSDFFVAPRAYMTYTEAKYFNGDTQLAQYTKRKNGFGLDLGYQIGSKAEVRVGEDYQWFGVNQTIGLPENEDFKLTPWVTSLRFQYLGQDDVQLPTRGSIVHTDFIYSTKRPNGDTGYSQMNTYLAGFVPVMQRGTVFLTGRGGTSFRSENLGLAGFSAGGPLRLSAYEQGELLGDDYFLAQAGYMFRLARLNPVLGDSVYALGGYEVGKMWNGPTGTPSLPMDVTGALVLKSLIGPVYGGASFGDGGHKAWFIGLGRIF